MRNFDALALGSIQGCCGGVVEGVFDRPEHQRQRRPEFMTDVGEEQSLGPINFSQSLGAAPLFLIGLGVCDACADFAGRQFEKAPIRVVKCPKRIETRNEHALACGFTPRRNGNERGLVRALIPKAFWKFGAETRYEMGNHSRFLPANDIG